MSCGTVCKEQNTKCKCIVKETVLCGKQDTCGKKNSCCPDPCESDECVEVYRDLGECLKKAVLSAVQKEKEASCC